MRSADEYQYTSFGQLYRKLLTKIYLILREFILSEGDHI